MEEIKEILKRLKNIEAKIDTSFDSAMAPKGIEKKIDNLGRITLPINIRRELDLDEGSKLKVYTLGNKIILEKSK